MRTALVLLLVLAIASPVAACLNDSATQPAENEFNSAYATRPSPVERIFQPIALLMLIPPLALVGLGCWLRMRDRRQRERQQQLRYRRLAARGRDGA